MVFTKNHSLSKYIWFLEEKCDIVFRQWQEEFHLERYFIIFQKYGLVELDLLWALCKIWVLFNFIENR